jgi:hypothetical protein
MIESTTQNPTIAPEVAASIGRLQKARKAASSHATPSDIIDSFVPKDIESMGLFIPVPNINKIVLLEEIDSPFITGQGSPSIEDAKRALFILAQSTSGPIKQAIRAGLFEEACDAWAEVLPAGVLNGAALRVAEALDKSFSTAVTYDEEGKGVPLADHPSPATGSGGSSPSPTA